jgi:hypothetical protein
MQQWCNSDAFDLGSFMSFALFRDVIDCIVSCCNALGVCLKNSDQTVIKQWCNSDATVMEQWCLWFEKFNVICVVLRCHWSYFILLQCLGSVFGDTRPFEKNSDQTVTQQWSNSDATVIEQWCLWVRLFYVIFKVWRCHWSYSILLQCIWSVIMHLLVTQDHLKKQWSNSDETVMEQWYLWFEQIYVICKILRCHWSYFILLQCPGSVVIDLFYTKNSDQTVIWFVSNRTVQPFDLSSFMSFASFWDVIHCIFSFCNVFEVW